MLTNCCLFLMLKGYYKVSFPRNIFSFLKSFCCQTSFGHSFSQVVQSMCVFSVSSNLVVLSIIICSYNPNECGNTLSSTTVQKGVN